LIHYSGGLLADRAGRLNLLWPLTLISGLLCLFLWLLGNTLAILVLFVCCFGFTVSNINALPASVVGQITPDASLGARVGAFYSVVAVASLVGTPIGGALIVNKNEKEGYRWLILFSVSDQNVITAALETDIVQGVSLIVGSLFMLGSRLLHDKDLRKRW
jgi:MCP family monocarboxylic acid transporter-like MFS transporter 10